MSEQISTQDTPTPDCVETAKGAGTKRVNNLPIVGGLILLTAFLLAMGYNMYDKSTIRQAKADALEANRITSVAVPPVTRPAGPDVSMPSAPAYRMSGEAQHQGGTMQDDDAARQARAKKLAVLDAALNAEPSLEKFASRQGTANVALGNHAQPRPPLGMPPPPPGQQGSDGLDAMLGGGPSPVRNHAGFNPQNESGIYLMQSREAALSPLEIKAGSIIPGVMISGINSDLPGPIIGQVRQNVYDSATGQHLLIPAGAKLVGMYDSNVVSGEERVLIAWNRIIFPDSSAITLNNMPGADQSGYAGFNDKVDNHYWRTFGQALMLSVLSAGMQIGQQPKGSANGQLSATQIAAAATAMQFGMLGMQAARRGMNTPPTMEIRPGFVFNIMITKDMILPPWRGHPLVQKAATQEQEEETGTSGCY